MASSETGESSPNSRKVFGEVVQALREGFPIYMARQSPGMAIGRLRRDAMQNAIAKQGYPATGKNLYFHIEKGSSRPKRDIALLYIAATARTLDLSPAKMDLMIRAYNSPETVTREEIEIVRRGEELPELENTDLIRMLRLIKETLKTPEQSKALSPK